MNKSKFSDQNVSLYNRLMQLILTFLIQVLMQIPKRVLMKSTAVYDSLLRERAQEVAMPLIESQLIATGEHGCYQGLIGAGQADGNTHNSPLVGSLGEEVGQHPILGVYYFHIS